ncbi:MAG: LysM peptidoglycan-binding domain-containing protein [Actinobacteria bacterium]|nr:LysM peptidoglycan-binding domain-containing protein [Actinomycetota bacterium]
MGGVRLVIGRRSSLAHYGAPVAFLLAFTVAVLVVRAGLSDGNDASTPRATVLDTSGTTTSPPPRTRPGTTTISAEAKYYEIEAGDTLETVAAQFDTTVEQLLVLNPDVDPVALGIGERIRVK